VLINPNNPGDLNSPESWRPSAAAGGAPGTDDRTSLTSWLAGRPNTDPLADPDGDGVTQLMAFATGARAVAPAYAFLPSVKVESITVNGTPGLYPVVEVRELIGATGITQSIESSTGLQAWAPAGMVLISVTDRGDGTVSRRFRTATPAGAGSTFFRVAVRQTP
jgi:hypothetical protein